MNELMVHEVLVGHECDFFYLQLMAKLEPVPFKLCQKGKEFSPYHCLELSLLGVSWKTCWELSFQYISSVLVLESVDLDERKVEVVDQLQLK